MSNEEEFRTVKIPMFSGRQKDWDVWATKFMTALGGKGYSYLAIPGGDPIPTENDVRADDADGKIGKKLKLDNAAAFNMLIQAMDTSTKQGRLAFYRVKSAMDKVNYRCGHFETAWNKLLAKYESNKKPDVQDEVDKYYRKRMKEGESPEKFISDLDIMREKRESLGEKILDERFLGDIISKLPKSKEEGQLSPYQLKRPEWTARIGAANDPLSVKDLATKLQQLYIQMYPKRAGEDGEVEDDEGEEEEVEGDRALAAYNSGQVKKKCFRCGEWGHLARNCPKVGDSGNHYSGNGQYSRNQYSGQGYSGGGGQYQGNRYGQGLGGQASGQMNQQWRPVRKCHHCGKLGHIKEYCWQLHGGPNTGGPNNTGRRSEQQMRNSENVGQQEATRERETEEAGNVGQESKVEYEIVLHAGAIMELAKKGMMDITVVRPEVIEVDEVVLSEEEFKVEDEEVVESIKECPEELNVCEVDQALVMKENFEVGNDEDWWEAYLATADATMCLIADIEEAKFAGGSTIKDEEEANDDSGWEVVKKKPKPKKPVKPDDKRKKSVTLQKYEDKVDPGIKKEKKKKTSFNPTMSNNNQQVKPANRFEELRTEERDGEELNITEENEIGPVLPEEATESEHEKKILETSETSEIQERARPKAKAKYSLSVVIPNEQAHLSNSPEKKEDAKSRTVLWIGDSGASMHMGGSCEGMYDARPCNVEILIGDGKKMKAVLQGKLNVEFELGDRKHMSAVMEGYHYVPEMGNLFLFSILNTLNRGWKLGNEGLVMTLTKGERILRFNHIIRTPSGHLGGVRGRICEDDGAHASGWSGSPMPLNRFHQIMGHAHDWTSILTAKYYNIKVTGVLDPCEDCKLSKARQKNVTKVSEGTAAEPRDRLCLDISSVQDISFGGNKFWILVLDDKTDMIWSIFVKYKSELARKVDELIDAIETRGKVVKFIRLDNAGENKALEQLCARKKRNIEFEYTPRDSPQYNGKVERKFATLWSRVRSDLNAAKFPKRMRHGLWSECARHATDIENLLVTENKKELGPSYRQFYGSDWAGVEYLHQFGEMGVIKTARKIQNKLENKGTTMIYCGRAVNHGADVHRFFNERTKRIIMSRDVQWLKKVYGDWKGGLSKAKKKQRVEYIEVDVPSGNDDVPSGNEAVPPVIDEDSDDLEDEVLADPVEYDDESFDEVEDNEQVGMEEPKGSPARTLPIRSGQKQMFQSPARVQGMVKQLKETRMSDSPIIGAMNTRTLRSGTKTRQPTEGANLVFETISEFAMKAGAVPLSDEKKSEEPIDYEKIDPSRYKDIFECPKTFEEAWNHPCPFQRKMWRAAILKELEKMLQLKVWVKIKRDMMPRNRRCVKYKWVLEIKRDGRFRARLVACGYSQVGGVDFTEVFSPVVNDTSFRLWLIWSMIYRKKRLVFDIDVAFLNGDLEEEIFMDCRL